MVVCSIRFIQNMKHKTPYATLLGVRAEVGGWGSPARGLSLTRKRYVWNGGHDKAVHILPGYPKCFPTK